MAASYQLKREGKQPIPSPHWEMDMQYFLRSASNVFYLLTIIGGFVAAWVVFVSIKNMAIAGGPDFSSVIALSFPIIPYCIARAFDGIRANDYTPR